MGDVRRRGEGGGTSGVSRKEPLNSSILPLNAFAWAFVDLVLHEFLILFRNRGHVDMLSVQMGLGQAIVIHPEVFGKIVGALATGRAIVFIYSDYTGGHSIS
jgi:hypothetical protein